MIIDFSSQPQLNTDMGSSSIKVKRFHISRHNQLEFHWPVHFKCLDPWYFWYLRYSWKNC